MNTIAIFGAGPSLGLAVARRFGRENYQVGLVARDQGRLEGMVAQLAGEGIEAAAFPADLTDQAAALAATEAVEERFGPIDVLDYNTAASVDDLRRQPSQT